MRLSGKIAIVTGGGRGIGKNIALSYAREGAAVVVAARTEGEIEATAREIAAAGGESLALRTDVTRYDEAERLVDSVLRRFGRIDILVNDAGVQGPIGLLAETKPEEWVYAVTVNLVGTFHCCRAAVPPMISRGRGKIINVSGGGSVSPRPHFTSYSASKAGVARLTESLAPELAQYNIDVNTMAPGATPTEMLREVAAHAAEAGEGEAGQARAVLGGGGVDTERQAALAVFLASSDSDGLTGRMLHTNDDWPSFAGRIGEIMASDEYTVKRVQP